MFALKRLLPALGLLLLTACPNSDRVPEDAGTAPIDTGVDSGVVADAAVDAGPEDAMPQDAAPDAGQRTRTVRAHGLAPAVGEASNETRTVRGRISTPTLVRTSSNAKRRVRGGVGATSR